MRLVLLLLLSLTPAFAADKVHLLRDFNPGKYVSGPRLTPAIQKDKGALMIFWIYELQVQRNGSQLIAFQKIADEHKDDLVVIGIEDSFQPTTPKNVLALLKKSGVTYSTYIGCQKPLKNNLYPFVCAFDREGKMVFSGNPTGEELAEAISKAAAKPEKKDGTKDDKEKPKADPKKAA
jgi:hypothetical protein